MLLDGREQLVEGRAVAAHPLAPALTCRLTSPAISGLSPPRTSPLTSALTPPLTSSLISARIRTMGRHRHGCYHHGCPQRRIRCVRSRGGAAAAAAAATTTSAGGITRGATGRGRCGGRRGVRRGAPGRAFLLALLAPGRGRRLLPPPLPALVRRPLPPPPAAPLALPPPALALLLVGVLRQEQRHHRVRIRSLLRTPLLARAGVRGGSRGWGWGWGWGLGLV